MQEKKQLRKLENKGKALLRAEAVVVFNEISFDNIQLCHLSDCPPPPPQTPSVVEASPLPASTARIVAYLRSRCLDTLTRLQPIPWCPEFRVPLQEYYIALSLLANGAHGDRVQQPLELDQMLAPLTVRGQGRGAGREEAGDGGMVRYDRKGDNCWHRRDIGKGVSAKWAQESGFIGCCMLGS